MTAIIETVTAFFGPLGSLVAGAVAFLIFVFGVFLRGKQSERNAAERRGLERRIIREEIEDDVEGMDSNTRDDRLAEWMRDRDE